MAKRTRRPRPDDHRDEDRVTARALARDMGIDEKIRQMFLERAAQLARRRAKERRNGR